MDARQLPYEAPDPRAGNETERRMYEKWFAETRTGRKVVAVIDEPVGCTSCVFYAGRWCARFWSKPSVLWNHMNEPETRGFACSLAKNHIVCVTDADDRGYRPVWCPLVPVEEPC